MASRQPGPSQYSYCEQRWLALGRAGCLRSAPGLSEHQAMDLSHLPPSPNLISGELGEAGSSPCKPSHPKPQGTIDSRSPATTGRQKACDLFQEVQNPRAYCGGAARGALGCEAYCYMTPQLPKTACLQSSLANLPAFPKAVTGLAFTSL